MKTKIIKELKHKSFFPFAVIVLGSAVVAFGLAAFLVPHRIVAGGTSGLATIIYYLTDFPIGILAILLDISLFLWAFFTLGFGFLSRTFLAAMLMGIFLQIFNLLISEPLSPDPLLSCLYGGFITGTGMGVIFKYGATTGGTDLFAMMLRHYFGWKLGTGLLLADGIIIAFSGIIFSFDLILYGILTVFIAGRMVDFIQMGTATGKGVFIMSPHWEEIRQVIFEKVNRGVTLFYGKGGYVEKSGCILYTVVSPHEVETLKDAVAAVDKDAFLVVTSTNEVLGEGFFREKR